MTEEIPRFEGDREDTYAEVEAVGELGAKSLCITLGVPGSKFEVQLSGETLVHFFTQANYETAIALNQADEDTVCSACGCDHTVSRVDWYTEESFKGNVRSRDKKEEADITEFCGSPTTFPVALCCDCVCPK